MTTDLTLDLLRESGAIKTGHFLLASGRHSDQYVEKFDLLRQPVLTSRICEGFAERFRNKRVDVVAGPTTGGVILAYEVGRQLGVRAAYAERVGGGASEREFRRGTSFEAGSRVLVVDDILTTGGSVRETLAALRAHPVEIVAVSVLVDRSGGSVRFGDTPLDSLIQLDIKTWDAADCPMCASGSVAVKPGTTAATQ